MAKSRINLSSAEKARNRITATQNKQIISMYKNAVDKIHKQMQFLEGKENVSSILRRQYLSILEKQIEQEIKGISKELESTIKKGVQEVSTEVVECNKEWLKKVGFKTTSAWSNVPTKIIKSVMTGNLYDKEMPLSARIWSAEKKALDDINYIISQGITLNKSAYDIAKDLEVYVNPTVRKQWDWNKVYPGTNKKIDYSAQRLARTMVSHAYQQSLILTTKHNPFVTGIQWRSALIHGRTCQLCTDRNGVIFKKDELPLDHPNGLCTYITVMEKSTDQITDDIANWYKSPRGTYPEIDKFADSLGDY